MSQIGNALSLPRDVWGQWDRESVQLQREMNAVFNDLAASVSQVVPIAKLISYFQTVSDSGQVSVTLDGRSKAKADQQTYAYHGTPLPIINSTFGYGWRQVLAAASEGYQLDAAGRINAFDKVYSKAESITLDGDASISVDGAPLYGLRNHPKRNSRSTGVTLNGASGANWKAEVIALLKLLHDDNFKTGVTIYVNWDDWFYASNTDYSTTKGDKTIAQHVLEIAGVNAVVPSDSLAADEMIAVVKDRRVLQVMNGMPISTRPLFRANPEDDYDFDTMMSTALQIKHDAEDRCGIAVSN
jgi:hypothetical protein